jgi:alpha-glucosidase
MARGFTVLYFQFPLCFNLPKRTAITMTTPQPTPLWWQTGVVYQIYPRSYMDSNNDGIGDLDGITSRLDYLASLGINAIWLSPFMRSPMKDFGYDVADYTDVDPIFGDLAAFDRFVAAAKARHIKVIIDYVPNHTSDQHAWFQESRSSKDNPKRDWYVWADAKSDGSLPNNWLSVFGGPAWELDPQTGQYYLHSFLKEQPDLNWRNPQVKAAMLDVLRFWLERGVDGFRIDVAHFIMKDPAMRDNPLNSSGEGVPFKPMGQYDSQIHLYDKGHQDVHAVFREIRALLNSFDAVGPRYSVGEIHIFDWDEWATYYGQNNDELHMPFNFGLVNLDWNPAWIRRVVESVEAALAKRPTTAPGAWPNYVLGNHDEHRIASRIGAAQARVAMMLLLTLRGTPTIYYGDEMAMPDTHIPPEREQDPWGINMPGLGLGRDPERTPMQWDTSANAGFSAANVETWLPIGDDYTTYNVASQNQDPQSTLKFSRQLLALRHAQAALHSGTYQTASGTIPDSCYAYLRTDGTTRYLIALNLRDTPATLSIAGGGNGAVTLSTHLDRTETVDLSALHLRPNEGCIILL